MVALLLRWGGAPGRAQKHGQKAPKHTKQQHPGRRTARHVAP
jgi:hypothetical protein